LWSTRKAYVPGFSPIAAVLCAPQSSEFVQRQSCERMTRTIWSLLDPSEPQVTFTPEKVQ
jgi:hypothetical protein